ncbi:unnamed protein product, partial [Leptidea sinapis]
FDLCRL